MSSNEYEYIVVGLGAAGTAASVALTRAGKTVLGLEAQEYIGGRVLTVPFGDGVVELGAEWIHGEKKNIVYENAIKNEIKLIPQGVDLITFRSDGSQPDKDVQNLINILVQQQQCDEMQLPDEPGAFGEYVANHVKQYIADVKPELLNDEDFMEQLMEFMNLLINNHNASNDWMDVDAHDKYTALDGHLYMSWHKYGFKTFFEILLNKHNNGLGWPNLEIKLNTEVAQINWSCNPKEKVSVVCSNGAKYTADSVIITVSLGVLKERHASLFKPNLPDYKIFAINKIPMGVVDKIELSFDQVWWPLDTPFFGFLWKGEDKRKIEKADYWVTKIFAASIPAGAKNVLTFWTSGEIGKLVETLPEHVVKSKCRELLQKFMGADLVVPQPAGVLRSKWYMNPYTRGSYTYDSVSCASYPTIRTDLTSPVLDASGKPRLLFAGEATHETHFSTVHGASESGYREAMRLLKYNSKI